MRERGFTLIELLVVIAIVGVLAAIAIPQYSAYRVRAFNASALAALRDSVTAQEAVFADRGAYVNCISPFDCELNLPGLKIPTSGGAYQVNPIRHDVAVDGNSFTAFAAHQSGNTTQRYDSITGLFIHD